VSDELSTDERMVVAGQLLAIRTVANALVTNVDAALRSIGAEAQPITLQEPASGIPTKCPKCGAPAEKITDYTGNGAPKWMCSVCEEKGGAW